MLGPVILLYNCTVMVSVFLYICTVNPGATLASVEVALTILKLTGTGGQAGRRADGQTGTSKYRDAYASKKLGLPNHPSPMMMQF